MNLLERLIVYHSEKHLQKYRDSARRMRAEFLKQYYSYLPEIERCYAHAGYWHGTGRYHYYHAIDSRYEDTDSQRTVDVLASILDTGALARHQDLWVKYNGRYKKTVSVAPSRMHARLYAHIHLRDGVWLEYIFGGTRFWMGFFVISAAMEIAARLGKREREFVKWTIFNKNTLKHLRTWAGAVRALGQYPVLPFWRVYDLRSDIGGNHAILFGIRRSAIQGDGVLPFIKKFEVRVEQTLQLQDMTHVEVPLEDVEKTKQTLRERNVSLPVIPLEFGELYCSQFSLRQLVYV